MKYIVSQSQIEDFLSKSLDVKDPSQKHVHIGIMELAKELMSTPLSKEIFIGLCSQYEDEDILYEDEDILYIANRLKEILFSKRGYL